MSRAARNLEIAPGSHHHQGGKPRTIPSRDELEAERVRLRLLPRSPERSRALLLVSRRLTALEYRSLWKVA